MTERPVVFVCLHGAAKSVIAAMRLQRLADERGVKVRATFAGTEPDAEIAPRVVAELCAEGIDLRRERPRTVTADELARAWRVISFGPDLSTFAPGTRAERWDVPAVSDDYARARDAIVQRLPRLLAEAAQ